MKFINRIIPAFIKHLDHNLLLNKPVLWIFKIPQLLFWQACILVLSTLFCYVYPQQLGKFPETGFILFIIGLANSLIVLLWVFYSNQFDLRTRNIHVPRFFEHARIGSYTLAIGLLIANILACHSILSFQTTRIVAPIGQEEFLRIDEKVNNFHSNVDFYARGFKTTTSINSSKVKIIDTTFISEKEVLVLCDEIGELNKVYGNGIRYAAEQIYEMVQDSLKLDYNGEYQRVNGYSRLDSLSQLRFNSNHIARKFIYLRDFWEDLSRDGGEIMLIISLISCLIILLICYFKLFGIYQIITGILSPVLLSIIVAVIGFLLSELIGHVYWPYDEETALTLLFAFIVFSYIKGYRYNYQSKKRIVFLQNLPIAICFFIPFLYDEFLEPLFNCQQYFDIDGELSSYYRDGYSLNPDFENCRTHQPIYRFWTQFGLFILFQFVAFPASLKLLYKQYYLPKK